VWGWAEPASGEPGYLFEVGWAVQPGLGCGGFACGCILVSLFIRSKQFFRFVLRVLFFMVSDSAVGYANREQAGIKKKETSNLDPAQK